MNNKVLTIVLIVLFALFFGNKIFKGKKTASFDKTFSAIDSEQIDQVFVYSKGNSSTYELRKEDNKWVGFQNNQSYRLNEDRVNSFLDAISDIQIKRLAAKSKEKWGQYEVGDESGNRIKILKSDKILLDFVVGRFSFDQQSRSATSYLRKTDEEEVFAMDGFASMTLNQDFNGLRYNKVTDLAANQIAGVNLDENGKSLTLKKVNGEWTDFIGNAIDSSAVASYLSGIANLTSSTFAENMKGNNKTNLTFSMMDGSKNAISISRDSAKFVISSDQEDIYFSSDSSGVFKKLVLDFKDLFQQ